MVFIMAQSVVERSLKLSVLAGCVWSLGVLTGCSAKAPVLPELNQLDTAKQDLVKPKAKCDALGIVFDVVETPLAVLDRLPASSAKGISTTPNVVWPLLDGIQNTTMVVIGVTSPEYLLLGPVVDTVSSIGVDMLLLAYDPYLLKRNSRVVNLLGRAKDSVLGTPKRVVNHLDGMWSKISECSDTLFGVTSKPVVGVASASRKVPASSLSVAQK